MVWTDVAFRMLAEFAVKNENSGLTNNTFQKTLWLFAAFRCVRLVLWDERRKRLVSFGELRGAHQI
jgi:hypothetical protein